MTTQAPSTRSGPFVHEVLGRSDYAIISELIAPNTRVLDLGCGEGELLAWLQEHKGVEARGVELNGSRVQRAIARGVSVYQGDIDQGLADYPDDAFDYVILSQTLQEVRAPLKVLREMLRVGRRAIVAFPNFGHWRVRLAHLWSGRAPKTRLFPYDWYNSPNIHFLTVHDFEALARQEAWTMERALFLTGHHTISALPNMMAETAVFLVRRSLAGVS
jgi:methionine biosynthesis protein MetW